MIAVRRASTLPILANIVVRSHQPAAVVVMESLGPIDAEHARKLRDY